MATILSSNPGVLRFSDFGAKGDYDINLGPGNGETDNLAAWNAAMKAMRDADPIGVGSGVTLEIGPGFYYFSDTAYITAGCIIRGPGRAGTSTRTAFYFAADKPGFWALSGAQCLSILGISNGSADQSVIENMQLRGIGGTSPTAHGFTMNAACTLRNFQVLHFGGDGIHIEGDVTASPSTNANFWNVDNILCAFNGGDGFRASGGDSNAGVGRNILGFSNGKYGLNESSFLGNSYNQMLMQGNGIQGYLDLSAIKINIKLYVRPSSAGLGDQLRIAFVGDSGAGVTTTTSANHNDVTVHFNPGVSILSDVFTALAGLFYYDYLPGANHGYVLQAGDAFALTNIALGVGGAFKFSGALNLTAVQGLYCEQGQYSFCDAPIVITGGSDLSIPTASSSFGITMHGTTATHLRDIPLYPSPSDPGGNGYGNYGKVSFGLLNDPINLLSLRWGTAGLNPTEGPASATGTVDSGSYTFRYDPVGGTFGLGWFYMYDQDGGYTNFGWATKRAKSFGQTAGAGVGDFAVTQGLWFGPPDSAIMRFGYGTAYPVSGAHRKGELIWNTAFEAGGPMGWACIASGTPGTWLAIGGRGTLEGFRGATLCSAARVNAGAGANASVSLNADANDVRGIITVTTNVADTPSADSKIAQINLSAELNAVAAYPAVPYIVLTPANKAAADLGTNVLVDPADNTATKFFIRSSSTPLPATTAATYKWQYVVVA